ncbi:unnamed protein product [Rotaria socialis]|uniref:Uncharacterized protein n=1 Tax=Rotaria socialis TaxID=392032 RepID=A0A821AAV5_9BILA|nr:unnamed protein product [Rotaria socialis]CAF3483171.1 unnamed protein product [Rotaria socialis]CAF3647750.1 unnamed protein product [Rotaria socialis]CAF4104184.1 unnamed protein product [Rotaria socialis]CAF4543221.1 unnamed protein product [Rotaria socialis]
MFVIVIYVFLVYVAYQVYKHFCPPPDVNSQGKYVLISGCDSGFGNALAIELDKRGFNVLAGIFGEQSREALTSTLSSRATVFCIDISKEDQINSAYEIVKDKTNVLHALVNNAGICENGLIDWTSMDTMRQHMDVNFFGHVAMTKTFLPLLIAKRDSRVVNVSSIAGFLAGPSIAAYSASKYALESFSDCLRREMAVWGLRVSIIEPGAMRTPIVEGLDLAAHKQWVSIPDDVKERWGEEFFQHQVKKLEKNTVLKMAENPNKVVEALRHAIMNTCPEIRYRPGWQSSLIFFPLSMCPAWFIDFLVEMGRDKSVNPAGVRKQLTD